MEGLSRSRCFVLPRLLAMFLLAACGSVPSTSQAQSGSPNPAAPYTPPSTPFQPNISPNFPEVLGANPYTRPQSPVADSSVGGLPPRSFPAQGFSPQLGAVPARPPLNQLNQGAAPYPPRNPGTPPGQPPRGNQAMAPPLVSPSLAGPPYGPAPSAGANGDRLASLPVDAVRTMPGNAAPAMRRRPTTRQSRRHPTIKRGRPAARPDLRSNPTRRPDRPPQRSSRSSSPRKSSLRSMASPSWPATSRDW